MLDCRQQNLGVLHLLTGFSVVWSDTLPQLHLWRKMLGVFNSSWAVLFWAPAGVWQLNMTTYRHVSIEVVFPVKLGYRIDPAIQGECSHHTSLHTPTIQYWKSPRFSKVQWWDQAVDLGREFILGTREQLAFGLNLCMNFKADYTFPFLTTWKWQLYVIISLTQLKLSKRKLYRITDWRVSHWNFRKEWNVRWRIRQKLSGRTAYLNAGLISLRDR